MKYDLRLSLPYNCGHRIAISNVCDYGIDSIRNRHAVEEIWLGAIGLERNSRDVTTQLLQPSR